jgi:ABC-type multidrug transport system ATPase subunit
MGGWGGSSCPLDPSPVVDSTVNETGHEAILTGLVPFMQSEMQACGCVNMMKYFEPSLMGCMCEPKLTNCTAFKDLIMEDTDTGKHAAVLALPILVDQLGGGGMPWGRSRKLEEHEAALEDLRSRAIDDASARLAKHQEKEAQIREMIKAAKEKKAEEEARETAEQETFRGRVKSALTDILVAVEGPKQRTRRFRSADRALSEAEDVKCSDFNRDPCGCGAQVQCEYDHQSCIIESSRGGRDASRRLQRPPAASDASSPPVGELGECKDLDDGTGGFGAIFGRGRHAALTSCMECPSKEGCSVTQLWDRLGPSLKGLKPRVKIFESKEDIDQAVLLEGYEWGDVEVGGVKKGDTPICAALHFKPATGSSVDVNIQLNASNLGRDINLLDQTYKWTEPSRFQRFEGYLTGGATAYTAMQKFIENFALEKAGHPDALHGNMTEPYFVPFGTDGSERFGIAVWTPEQIPGLTTNFHRCSWVIAICFASTVFRERVQNIRDGLQMMGLTDKGYYLSVWVFFGLWTIVPTVVACLYMRTPLQYSDPFTYPGSNFAYVWYMMYCEMYTVFLLCLIIGCMTDRRPVMFIGTFVMLDFCRLIPEQAISAAMPAWQRFGLSLVLPVASMQQSLWAFRELLLFGAPLTLDTIFIKVYHEGAWSFFDGMYMITLSVIFYTAVYVYVDQVLAAPTTQKWHWPVTMWMKKNEEVEERILSSGNPKFFEETSTAHAEMEKNGQCMMVKDLVKTFQAHGLTTYAVQGLSLTLYEGEIFCLLGHNGAGKTTAINCLTGICKKTSGTASAFGMSLDEFRATHRKDVGFCPQHSVLWMELTCLQHLVTFARYKGYDKKTATKEAYDVLEQLGMKRKAHTPAKALSGGMQRKLSLGIAFVCKPRLVFLDEPSSGMDATARQECWDFLRARREKTIILLTTHYMDEADCLGDRVMVMSAGKASCCGSGQFLKSAFNCGYMLRCLMPEGVTSETAKGEIVNTVEKFLGEPVSGRAGTGTELNLTIRMDQAGKFGVMFPQLDSAIKEGKLKEWSIAVCSLEEVFLRVASGHASSDDEGKAEAHAEKKVKLPETKRGVVKNSLQIRALFMRRAHCMKRSWLYLIVQTLAPAGYFFLVFFLITTIFASFFSSGDLSVDMKKYNEVLKRVDPDMVEMLPVAALPLGDDGEVGSLASRGFAESISVRDVAYSLEMAGLNPADFATECDDDAALADAWEVAEEERLEAERKFNESEKRREENPGACENNRRGGRPKDSRVLRMLLSKFKTEGRPGPLTRCGLQISPRGDKNATLSDLATDLRAINVTDLEVATRGFSCWLRAARAAEGKPDSTYGAMLLYGKDGGEVLLVNTTGMHTVPIMRNVRANALLQNLKKDDSISIGFSIFERTPREFGSLVETVLTIVALLLLGVGFAFPPPFYVAFIVEEKALGIKGQMLVSGVRGANYWIANWLFDIIPWLVATSLTVVVFWSFELNGFFEDGMFQVFVASMFAFVVHQVPFAYVLGQLFAEPSSAIIVVLLFNLIVFAVYLVWQSTMYAGRLDTGFRGAAEMLTPILRLHPNFCMSEALNVAQTVLGRLEANPPDEVSEEDKLICLEELAAGERSRWDCAESVWDWSAVGGPIYSSLAYSVLMMVGVMALEVLAQTPSIVYRWQKANDAKKLPTVSEDEEDDAVREEKKKVKAGAKTGPIEVSGVRKSYALGKMGKGGHHHAVKDLSWACDTGDVFGLLGVNGAGKTTMFQMLSGILVQNEGSVKIAGNDMLSASGLKSARNVLGYCPQHNPLVPIMSVRETVEMYGMIKGLSGAELAEARDLWIAAMDLKKHEWKLAGNLSGGNKRKLCVAVAMIGDPEIILLDEPSAGMDPEARRFMWDVIAEITQTRKQATVVLTTHSMEECEALCNKITIMVNGSFRCIGTHKEVKDLYGKGQELHLKLESPTKIEIAALQSKWSADGVGEGDSALVSREKLAAWADTNEPWLASAVRSPVAPFPEAVESSTASAAVLSEWYINAGNAKRILEWVKRLDSTAEWVAWASTSFRFKLLSGHNLTELFDNMYKNKDRLHMMEYAVSPTSLEQIFHSFAKEQTGSTEGQGVYDNSKELALQGLFAAVTPEDKTIQANLGGANVSSAA